MYVHDSYLDGIADAGAGMVESIALVDETGTEIASRKVKGTDFGMNTTEAGIWRPDTDLTFTITSGTTVAGWRAYDAPTDGVELGGADLVAEEYTNDGEYTLIGNDSGFVHQLGS